MKGNYGMSSEERRKVMLPMGLGLALGLVLGWLIDDLMFGAFIGILLGLAYGSRDLTTMRFPAHAVRNMVLSGALLLFSLFLMLRISDLEMLKNQQILIALVPTIPSLIFAYAVAKALASLDELQRRIQLEAIAIGFGGTMVFVTSFGMLGWAGVEQPNWGFVSVAMAGFWVLGKLWTLWKYR